MWERSRKKLSKGVSFDKRGVLVCSGKPGFCTGKGTDDPINIKANAVLGEPKRFAVVSRDGRVAGFAEAVPFPIEATDKNCKLSVVRQDAAGRRGSGARQRIYSLRNAVGHGKSGRGQRRA